MRRLALVLLGSSGLLPSPCTAASLQVTPVLLEVPAPGAASVVTLRNTGSKPIAVQTRIFRWFQEDGRERLEPTAGVVASPPAAELRPSQDYVVRIVRLDKSPVVGEEAYRLLIDELPEPQTRARTVALTVRHSIPLFFDASDASPARATWRVTRGAGGLSLTASNAGDARLRLSDVKLSDQSGRAFSFGSGLLGYVLGRSSMSWTVSAGKLAPAPGVKLAISGQSQDGPIRVQATVDPVR